jgi:hypothetical protein
VGVKIHASSKLLRSSSRQPVGHLNSTNHSFRQQGTTLRGDLGGSQVRSFLVVLGSRVL